MRNALFLVGFLFIAACGDGVNSVDDDGGNILPADAGADASLGIDAEPDIDAAPPCPMPPAGEPGGVCTESSQCDSADGAGDGYCLTENEPVAWPTEGYCIRFNCDSANPCPTGSVCTEYLDNGVSFGNVCLPECCEGGNCAEGRICADGFAGTLSFGSEVCLPGNPQALDGDSCETVEDCNENSICRNNELSFPGGLCATVNCEVFDDSTCAGGDARCIDPDGVGGQVPLCVDTCEQNSDCRTEDSYFCFDGTALNQGKFCRHPETGDGCFNDSDCGASPWTCLTDQPNGYCSVMNCTVGIEGNCPERSTCFDPDTNVEGDQFCTLDCDPADAQACRPGYSCQVVVDDLENDANDKYGCLENSPT